MKRITGVPGCRNVIMHQGRPTLLVNQTVSGSAYLKIGQQLINLWEHTRSMELQVMVNKDYPELHNLVNNVNRLMLATDEFAVIVIVSPKFKV